MLRRVISPSWAIKSSLDFGCLAKQEEREIQQKGYGSALFVLDACGGSDRIRKSDEEVLLFEPVAGGPCPKGLKL